MGKRDKYRRVTDLYVVGTEYVARDGTVFWLQTLNPFEMDEARHDAQAARSRLVMALRKHGSDELNKVEAGFYADGRDAAIKHLSEARSNESLVKIIEQIATDPDWKERVELVERGGNITDRPEGDPERELLLEANKAYVLELNARLQAEKEYQAQRFAEMDEEALKKEYIDLYINRRGNDIGMTEHRVTELWYAARICEGVQDDEGAWDHSACEHHKERVWEDREEVRGLPGDLLSELHATLSGLSMSPFEAKKWVRPGSSSGSSVPPSEAAASTASTPAATPSEPPGISP